MTRKNNKQKKNQTSKPKTPQVNQSMSKNPPQSLPSSFQITIEMLSDWHIGSGAGRTGDIDSLVKRDRNGLPYIPAKTLTGIWRDACELVAQGLDNNEDNGKWQQWVNYLFGDQPALAQGVVEPAPRHAALSIRAAHFPQSLSNAINSKDEKTSRQLKEAITFVKPGIKIDVKSGCAEQNCLRLEEQVRMGSILTADCTLKLPDQEDQKQVAYALLITGAAMIERLGANRRRGSGKCSFTLSEIQNELKTWIKWIEEHPDPPNIPDFDKKNKNQEETPYNQSSGDWLSVPLKITLRSPLVISQRTVGNVVETLDYIPGTHLLRLVARKLGKLGVNLIDAITNGDLLVTNATLEIDGQQSKPVPFALFYEKLGEGFKKGGKIYNLLVQTEPEREQLKGYRSGYINPTTRPQYETVPLTLGTHNTIEDRYQRPTSNVGGVYSYEAIKAGTILRAELRLRKSLADTLKRQNSNWWQEIRGCDRLGQSKKDDYGDVTIQVIKSPQPFKREVAPDDQPKDELNDKLNDKLYVWLLSDLLLRDERLRPTFSIDELARELSTKLEVKVTFSADNNDTLTLVTRQNRLDSWQVKWVLPRPSLVGLGAGTCIVFNIDKSPEPDKLANVEASGIGERTAESYGQVCFNHPLLTQRFSEFTSNQMLENKDSNSNQSKAKDNTIKAKDIAFDYARLIEIAAWREEIQREATKIASQLNDRKKILVITIENGDSRPSMSQLGALRTIISRLQSSNDSTSVGSWIDSVLAKPNRKEKWNNGSLDKIKDLVTNKDKIWQELKISPDLSLTQNARVELQNELWTEAVRTLINACILAHKRDLEKAEKTESVGV